MPQRSTHPQKDFGKLYQDQIHGAITLTPLAIKIIDCSEFQRLAGLKQLGFSDFAYRSARHSRLEHSVGTYFVCRQMMRRIEQNHERLDLPHPGKFISSRLAHFPHNSGKEPPGDDSYHARWRGLTEVVSAAALLHDIGHVPFGHTLEDEFKGILSKHDRLGGPRLYKMLFDEASELAAVFADSRQWLQGLSNDVLRKLIYLTLNWKEGITPVASFPQLLDEEISRARRGAQTERLYRLRQLQTWYAELRSNEDPLFHPFMSDVVGNTICSDLLDYLPRDRVNLGMEARKHKRLQRYFTIRPGTHYPDEGLRMSIMVTRTAKGGQRRDVASAVLNIMRERFEMAEGVYYHHKKCAASAMLAKLAEIAQAVDRENSKAGAGVMPRDNDAIYPAPWMENPAGETAKAPHVVHLSDHDLIEYLGTKIEVKLSEKQRETTLRQLQCRLYTGLRYRRKDIYRTFMVVDVPLISTKHGVDYFVHLCRGADRGNDSGRIELEQVLAEAAGAAEGDVIIYCAPSDMQSKEIDARLEIEPDKIVPLRTQTDFVYFDDVKTLQKYYQSLWRAYVFVTPEIFAEAGKCRAIFEAFCSKCDLPRQEVFKKVRGQPFELRKEDRSTAILNSFWSAVPFESVPPLLFPAIQEIATNDNLLASSQSSEAQFYRLTALFSVAVLDLDNEAKRSKRQKSEIARYRGFLLDGTMPPIPLPARGRDRSKPTYEAYVDDLMAVAADGGVPPLTAAEVWRVLEPLKAKKSDPEEIAAVEEHVATKWLPKVNELSSQRRARVRERLPKLRELFPEEELFGGRYKASVVIDELNNLLKESQ